jgi:hypothetical protein
MAFLSTRSFRLTGCIAWAFAVALLCIFWHSSEGRSFYLNLKIRGASTEAQVAGGQVIVETISDPIDRGSGIQMGVEDFSPEYKTDLVAQRTDILQNDRWSLGPFGVGRHDEWGDTIRGVWTPAWYVLSLLALPPIAWRLRRRFMDRLETGRFAVIQLPENR